MPRRLQGWGLHGGVAANRRRPHIVLVGCSCGWCDRAGCVFDAVGAWIILFKLAIATRVGLAMEFAVAVVLILLSTGSAMRLCCGLFARHAEPPGEVNNASQKDSRNRVNGERTGRLAARRPILRSFAVGLVHGLAGSAAIALVVLSAIHSRCGRRSI